MSSTSQSVQPGNDNRIWDGADKLIVTADPWTISPEAFYDIYDKCDDLCQSMNHAQIDGRRGTGKTFLMVNAYLRLRREFEDPEASPPYTLAIFIDLRQDVHAPEDASPATRALMLYRQILQLILTSSHRKGHRRDRRFWGLKDFLSEGTRWLRRVRARRHLRRYERYVKSLGDRILQESKYQQRTRRRHEIGGGAEVTTALVHKKALPLRSRIGLGTSHEHGDDVTAVGTHQIFAGKVRALLEAALESMQIKHLIIFLDEWSGSSIGSETQPYLYNLLIQTFPPGGKVVLKLATIPGSTRLSPTGYSATIRRVSLDRAAAARSNWMRNRLIRLLILNLKSCIGDAFPASRYQTEEEEEAGFPTFINDVFQNKESVDALAFASENLPRQMLILFMEAAQLRGSLTPDQKLSTGLIRMAAKEHFATYRDTVMRERVEIDLVFSTVEDHGCRVVDVEREPAFYRTLDWLVDEGVMFRCEVALRGSFDRYYLSYPAEVYRLSRIQDSEAQGLALFEALEMERVFACENYRNPPKVLLHKLASRLSQKAD